MRVLKMTLLLIAVLFLCSACEESYKELSREGYAGESTTLRGENEPAEEYGYFGASEPLKDYKPKSARPYGYHQIPYSPEYRYRSPSPYYRWPYRGVR